jgi:hypothetical protein
MLLGVILGICTLIGGAAAVVTFWPAVTVTTAGLFDPETSYSVSFVATNVGYVTLNDAEMAIGICSIENEKHDLWVTETWEYKERCGGIPKLAIANLKWMHHKLTHNDSMTATLSDTMTMLTEKYRAENPDIIAGLKTLSPLVSADVVVIVSYYPWVFPWKRRASFAFVAEKQPNDKILWKARPVEDYGEPFTSSDVVLHRWVPAEAIQRPRRAPTTPWPPPQNTIPKFP